MTDYRKRFMRSVISSTVFTVFFMAVCYVADKYFKINLMGFSKHFDSSLKSNTIDFIGLCIGIYIAVISILASQRTSLTVEISRKKYDVKFVAAISNGLIFNLITVVYLSFSKMDNSISLSFSIALAAISFSYFIRFLIYLVLMFCYNMSVIAIENQKEEEFKNELLSELEEIRKSLK